MTGFWRFVFERFTKVLVGGALAAMVWVAMLVFGPLIETRWFPVVDYKLTTIARRDNTLTLNVMFDKLRNCEYAGSQWYEVSGDKVFDRVPKATAPDPGVNRPVGQNYGRDWTIDLRPELPDHKLVTVLNHRCGLPWITQTIQGPFPIPPLQ